MRRGSIMAVVALAASGGLLAGVALYSALRADAPAGSVARAPNQPTGRTDTADPARPIDRKDKKLLLIDADIAKVMGIETRSAGPGMVVQRFVLSGTVGFNEDRVAHVFAGAPGFVDSVAKNLGDRVSAGETLVTLRSRDVAETKSNYLSARERVGVAEANYSREEALWRRKVSSEQDYLTTRRELADARGELRIAVQRLRAAGLRDADIEGIANQTADLLPVLPIIAPASGEIVERRATRGELVKEDRELFVIADLDTVWVNAQVPARLFSTVASGRSVTVRDKAGRSATGMIRYVSPVLSQESTGALVRVDLGNADRVWRPGAFVEVQVSGDSISAAVVVSSDAVQLLDGKPVVFVVVKEGFRVRPVALGAADDQWTVIKKGLTAGEVYAAGQTFVLRAEIEKGALDDND